MGRARKKRKSPGQKVKRAALERAAQLGTLEIFNLALALKGDEHYLFWNCLIPADDRSPVKKIIRDTATAVGEIGVDTARRAEVVVRREREATKRLRASLSRTRMGKRDKRIVELRDQPTPDGKPRSFGQIGKLLASENKSWTGRNGNPLSRKAVEKAYRRCQERGDT